MSDADAAAALRDGFMFIFGVLSTLLVVALGAWRISVCRRRHHRALMRRLGKCYEATAILGVQIRTLGRLWGIVVESEPSTDSHGDESHGSGDSGQRRIGVA